MRAKEFINEDVEADAGTGMGSKKAGVKLNDIHHGAIPGLKTTPNLPSHYYDMYRLGIHMAGSPADQKMDPRSPVANQMAVMAYAPEEHEIINNSAKELGIELHALSDNSSSEPDDTNKVSPHHNPGPIKRKSK
jgi:hypothetical protein